MSPWPAGNSRMKILTNNCNVEGKYSGFTQYGGLYDLPYGIPCGIP
jgi:hypothetical protein